VPGAFTTKITHVQFTLSPFTSEQMAQIGSIMVDTITDRIRRAYTVEDQPAKPIVDRYAKRKIRYGRNPIRDWSWSGQTLGSFKVKRASENQVTIGFVNPTADLKAHVNNLREKQFGVSPKDEEALHAAVGASLRTQRIVLVEHESWPKPESFQSVA
jgi:hypothetical protein